LTVVLIRDHDDYWALNLSYSNLAAFGILISIINQVIITHTLIIYTVSAQG